MGERKKNRIVLLLWMMAMAVFMLTGCRAKNTGTVGGIRENSAQKIVTDEISKTTDVILVMDESGSMVHADPTRFAIEGAKLFVDLEKSSGINLGLVEFSNKISSTGLVDMTDKQNRENMKAILDGIVYDPPAHTDTGWGLLKAEEVLAERPEENRKIILLFTDGQTDIDVGTPGRTTEDSKKDVETAISQAQ